MANPHQYDAQPPSFGQIHYIAPVPSLPSASAAPYLQDSHAPVAGLEHGSSRSCGQRVAQRTATVVVAARGCIICCGPLPPRIARGGRKPIEVFSKACELLQVSFSEIQSEWDFGRGEKLPFCITCIEGLQRLFGLQEQLEILQRTLKEGVDIIRSRIRQTNNSILPTHDLKGANFRYRALGEVLHQSATASLKTIPIRTVSEPSSSNIVSDFTSIFNSATAPYQHPVSNLGFQQDLPIRLQEQQYTIPASQIHLTAYSTLLPIVGTPVDPQNTSIAHSVFASSGDGADEDKVSEELGSHDHETNFYDDDAGTEESSEGESASASDDDVASSVRKSKKGSVSRSTRKNANSARHRRASREGGGRGKAEEFTPVHTGQNGKLIFEGITITPGATGYLCGLCGKQCGKGHDSAAMRKVKIHIKGFHLGAYKCDQCDKNFTSNDILQQHFQRFHEQGTTPCDICGRPVRPRYIKHHQFTHMNAAEKAECIAGGFKPQYFNEKKERKYMCTTCGKLFSKQSVLRRHQISHKDPALRKDFKCDLCDRSYTTDQALKEHKSVNHDPENMRRAMCKYCNKLMFPKYLRKHMQTHIAKEERPFVCKICGRRLGNLKTLKLHEDAHNPTDKPEMFKFECDICGQRFLDYKRMRLHRRKNHSNHWKLAVPSQLINEVSMDKPGENNFIDDLNNEELQETGDGILTFHLYEVKKLENPAGYQCLTCSAEFREEGEDGENHIKNHIRTEHIGNFRCNICTKRMKNINEVIAHKRRDHMNKTQYACSICGRPGLAVQSLRNHEWYHKSAYDVADIINSGEGIPTRFQATLNQRQSILLELGFVYSFKCSLCDATYSMLDDLFQHRRKQHKGESTVKRRKWTAKADRKRKHPLGPSECPHCCKTFDSGAKVARHIAKVHNKKRVRKADESALVSNKKQQKEGEEVFSEEELQDLDLLCASKVKTEINSCDSSGSDSEDFSESEGQSDPEFKVTGTAKRSCKGGVALRNRTSLRPRRKVRYEYDEDQVFEPSDNIRIAVSRLPIPADTGTVKVKRENVIEYITPDGDLTEVTLLSEKDIKRSPQSSDAEEEYASDGGESDESD